MENVEVVLHEEPLGRVVAALGGIRVESYQGARKPPLWDWPIILDQGQGPEVIYDHPGRIPVSLRVAATRICKARLLAG